MYRYIKASYNNLDEFPDWFKRSVLGNPSIRVTLNSHGYDLANLKLTDVSTGNTPVYYLRDDYGHSVYIPGINDNSGASFNHRQRTFGKMSKHLIKDYTEDIIYIDNTVSKKSRKNRYQDPRREYGRYGRDYYAGQVYHKYSKYEDPKDGKEGYWTNGARGRDKSGYTIPNPAEKLAVFYENHQDRVADKVESVYQKLLNLKHEVFDIDMNAISKRGRTNYSRIINRFSNVVDRYNHIMNLLETVNPDLEKGNRYSYTIGIRELMGEIRNIQEDMHTLEKYLDNIDIADIW